MRANSKSCVPESKETPKQEAQAHSKKYLVKALKAKSPGTGGTTQGQGIANAGSNSGAGST